MSMAHIHKIYWGVDNRGDFPNTAGLRESVILPDSFSTNYINCYTWNLALPKLHDYFYNYNLRNMFLQSIFAWINSYCPDPKYAGTLCLDVEAYCGRLCTEQWFPEDWNNWTAFTERHHLVGTSFNYPRAVQKLFNDIYKQVKLARPNARVGFYGAAGVSVFELDQSEIYQLRNDENAWMYTDFDYVHPVWYAPAKIGNPQENSFLITEEVFVRWLRTNCSEHRRLRTLTGATCPTIFAISARYESSAGPYAYTYLSNRELELLLTIPTEYNFTKCILWDGLISENDRNTIQRIVQYAAEVRQNQIAGSVNLG